MASWSMFLLQTPTDMGVDPARGILCELSHAASRSLSVDLADAETLTFEMPGDSWQTALVKTGQTDVLLFYGDYPVQKFRVSGRSIAGDEDGNLTVSVTCSAYRMLLGKRIFHESDKKSWTSGDDTNQEDIAWAMINTSCSRNAGDGTWSITQGLTCATTKKRTRVGVNSAGYPTDFYVAGDVLLDAIEELAEMEDGFEWCIEPDRSSNVDSFRDLKFNAWDEGERTTHGGSSTYGFVLDYGGAVASFTIDEDIADFANVIRQAGVEDTSEYASGTGTAIWRPSTKNPASAVGFGRMERSMEPTRSESTSSTTELTADANAALARSLDARGTIRLELRPGRWPGPEDFWVGDYARVVINEDVFPDWVPNVMRVTEMEIDINDDGGEAVAVTVGRPLDNWFAEQKALYRNVARLNRR